MRVKRGYHSDKALQYSAESAVISAVQGKKPNPTINDSTKFPYSAIVTKYCSIVRRVLLSLVLFGSKVQYYSTKVLCHCGGNGSARMKKSPA